MTTDAYVSFSAILIRKMFRSLAFIGVLIYVIVVLVRAIPGGFVPEEDQGYIMVNAQLPDAASLERTDAVMKKAEAILEKNEAIEGFNTISGYSLLTSAYSSNMGFFFVQLKPWEERTTEEAHANGVVAALNAAFAQQIPEAGVIAFGPPSIPGLGTGAGFTMQLQDRSGGSPDYLAEQTQRFMEAARKRPEIGRIGTLYRATVPQVYADIDRSKVLKSGVQLNDVNTTLGALLGSSYVNDFNRFGRVYKVYVQAEPEFRQDPKQLGLFFVKNKGGGMVPLDTLVTTRPGSGPEFTNRFNLFRSAELTGVPAAGFSSTQALDALEATAREVLPPDMSFAWADMSYQERAAPGVAAVFMLAIFLVFLILAAQYQSWGLPFSVLLGTPFAAFGAYLGLWLARLYLGPSYVNNVFAQIGLIMLIGLAAKNAILIVEFAKMEVDQGKPLIEATLTGGEASVPADSDDRLRVHPRRRAAADRVGRRRRVAQGDGHGRVLRHARRDDPRRAADSDAVCRRAESDRRRQACAGAGAGAAADAGHRAWPGGPLRCATRVASFRPPRRSSHRACWRGCTVGPNYARPQLPTPPQYRFVAGDRAGAIAGRCAVVPGVRRSGAAGAHSRRASPTTSTCASPWRASKRRAPVPASPSRTSIRRSTASPVTACGRRRRPTRTTTRRIRAAPTGSSCRGRSICSAGSGARRRRRWRWRWRASRAGAACWSRWSATSRRTISCCASSTCSSRSPGETLRLNDETVDVLSEPPGRRRVESSRARSDPGQSRADGRRDSRDRTPDRGRRERAVAAAGPAAWTDHARAADHRRDACRRRFRRAFPRRSSSGGPTSSRRSSCSWRPTPTSAWRRRCSIPTISLTGFLGGISGDLTTFLGGSGAVWSASPGLLQPIFQAGRLRRNLEAAQARFDAALAEYQKAALNGYREVANALVTIQKLAEQRGQRELGVAALQDASDLSRSRYDSGLASYIEILTADQQLFEQQLLLAQTRGAELRARAELYRTLGGGWQP